MSDKIKGYTHAVEVLRGAGIKIDEKNRTQTWKFGKTYSQKVVNAGALLDKIELEKDNQFKTVWLDAHGELPEWKKGVAKKK